MALIKLNTTSGGSVTLTPADSSNNVTMTVPAENGTLLTTTTLTSSINTQLSAAIGVTIQAYNATLTSWASKTVPSGVVVGTTDSQTLTNKTLTSPTINNPTISGATISGATFTDGYTEESVTANTGTAYTIDLANGTLQILTLTGNCTYTFPTPTAGKSFTLVQKQDATGSRTVVWAATVKWPAGVAPTITSTASKADVFSFLADGTNWIARTIGQNYL